jgi:AraC-like DNA-binding protein
MKSKLYISSFCDLCSDKCDLNGENNCKRHTISDPVIKIEGDFSPGSIEMIDMRPGGIGYVIDIKKEEEFYTRFSCKDGPIELAVCLEGCTEYIYDNEPIKGYKHTANGSQCFIYRMSECSGQGHKKDSKPMKTVGVSMNPYIFKMLIDDYCGKIKKEFEGLTDFTRPVIVMKDLRSTPAMEAIARSILDCRFNEPQRRIYIIGKLRELTALIITEYILEQPEKESSILRFGDSQKIAKAKEILLRDISDPPVIAELSKMAGINELKLKTGFKELYGTTVCNFVKQRRMEKAKNILESGKASVSEAAWSVGYTNVSYFISVFRSYHGLNPGEFLSKIKTKIPASRI